MKEIYSAPEVEIIVFEAEDVITASDLVLPRAGEP